MPAPLMRIETPETLPHETEVVVIGAGIIGVTAAYYLARRGVPVVLLDKGPVGAEQSSRNWGWCRQQNRDARELPMATKALELWDRFRQELDQDIGFRRCGLLYLSNEDAELETWANWCRFAAGEGVVSHILDRKAATERGVATGKTWKGGVFSESDAVGDPARSVPLLAQGVMAAGGHVMQNCAALGLEKAAGRVAGIITERGPIRCKEVVLAGGAWASSFCHQLGISFPQASVRATILSVAPGIEGLPEALHTKGASVTRRGDGGYTLAISGFALVDPTWQKLRYASDFLPMFAKHARALSPGGLATLRTGAETRRRWAPGVPTPLQKTRTLDPKPTQWIVRKTLRQSQDLLPALKGARLQSAWAGLIDNTPDGVPVIDRSEQLEGFTLAAGFSGHGFGIGPAAGHLVADLVTGDTPIVDPSQFRLSRLRASSWGRVNEF